MSFIHLLLTICLMLIGGKAILSRKEKDLFGFLRIRKVPLFLLPVLFLESFLLLISATFVNACSEIFFENVIETTLENAARNLVFSLVVICIIPAIFEEVLFRGAFMRSFSDQKKGLLLSAVLFAIWHLNPNQMSYTFLAGLLLGILALWTDNLVCSMIVHFLFNLYNIIATALPATSKAGQVIMAIEKFITLLMPPFYTTKGIFLWKNFMVGFFSFIMTIVIYLGVLWWARGRLSGMIPSKIN